jgi:hypothetical protein
MAISGIVIVQPDAHDVVGELAADRDGAESWIADLSLDGTN